MKLPCILTIAGSDSGGGAGIQADLKTITVLGGFGMSVVTALTVQNTLGVYAIHDVPPDFIKAQFDAVASDIGIDAAKIGMLSNIHTIQAVASKIREYGIKTLVLDPVMVAKSGDRLLQEDAIECIVKKLIPLSFVITPNISEAEVLADIKILTDTDIRESARRIYAKGVPYVIIKGGHLPGEARDTLFDGKSFYEYASPRIETMDTHGTGCTFSAAIATELAKGRSVPDAIKRAKEYTTTAIRFSLRLGGGHGPTNHGAELFRESARMMCVQELKKAINMLKYSQCGNIIPEVQSNLVYALPFAENFEDIAGIPGRIIRVGDNVETLHDPDFGVTKHISKIVLTAMRTDPSYRSAMNIVFSEKIVQLCKEAGWIVSSFNREEEPEEIKIKEGSSLEWGTQEAINRIGKVPDVIFDRGEVGKEPIVRLLGYTPADVIEKVLYISTKLKIAEKG
ncbi:MAG: bifunctional hydroxymethylpyrimidine kinase/phosphomethylpyrimidine kinase [Candidatus Marinimicrobia bacterium]|nr:bifunctional hydroxymethylpyrimidine kinase/phosphomethylpyrimidine kinase [Candidatus Neomarinimicrobiota bacterium]